ncbi:MAG: hypothetical protein BIFFINMI_03149 [Phycisphaerae bacterium]|nr:hypothetical protein [Phycisphaerae bacterium]
MTSASLGAISLLIATVIAAATALAAVAAVAFRRDGLARLARLGLLLLAVAFTLSCGILIEAFVHNRFVIRYVADYSDTALSIGYKVAGLWAGQAGSLLLWGWLVAAMGLLAAFGLRRREPAMQGGLILTVALVCGFFGLVMVAVDEARPFTTYDAIARVGQEQMLDAFSPGDRSRIGECANALQNAVMGLAAQKDKPWSGTIARVTFKSESVPVPPDPSHPGLHTHQEYAAYIYLADGQPGGSQALLKALSARVGRLAPASEGVGLKPLLQNPAMVIHPPMLFVGYAGFTLPLALLVGGLLAGGLDHDWIARARRWTVVSWLFLGVGIVLGMWWAYVELGWGGYWAWDPVENASLLPWFVGTALLHALIVMRHRRLFKPIVAILTLLTFALCIFATYLVRSGVIQSVHAFGTSVIGDWFLWFLIGSIVVSAVAMVVRFRVLAPEGEARWGGREWALAAACALLVLMCGFTLVGTTWPLIYKALFGKMGLAMDQSFYNNRVLLLWGLPTVALMAFGPLIAYGKKIPDDLVRLLAFCGVAAAVAVGLPYLAGVKSLWAGVGLAILGLTFGLVVYDFVRAMSLERGQGPGGVGLAFRIFDANHRRYGAQLAHAGVALFMMGVLGTALFSTDQKVLLRPHQTVAATNPLTGGEYTVTYDQFVEKAADTYDYQAVVLAVDAGGGLIRLTPEQRSYYSHVGETYGEIDMNSTAARDVYVALIGVGNGGLVRLNIMVKPLAMWLWIGATAIALGGLLCLVPPLIPAFNPATARQGDRKPERPRPTPAKAQSPSTART